MFYVKAIGAYVGCRGFAPTMSDWAHGGGDSKFVIESSMLDGSCMDSMFRVQVLGFQFSSIFAGGDLL